MAECLSTYARPASPVPSTISKYINTSTQFQDHLPNTVQPHIPVLPVLQALRRGSRLGTGRGMGSLSPMRTSATSSSMSSLLQGRGNGEPSSVTAHRRGPPTFSCLGAYSPGRRSRRLGTQVSGGSRMLTRPTRKLSAAVSNTWKRPSWALFCEYSHFLVPTSQKPANLPQGYSRIQPTISVMVSGSQLSQGSGP